MNEITDIFEQYINQYGSYDIAESQFKKDAADDPELRATYREWCHEVGSSEKNGFRDFCDEHSQGINDMWNALSDYDDNE